MRMDFTCFSFIDNCFVAMMVNTSIKARQCSIELINNSINANFVINPTCKDPLFQMSIWTTPIHELIKQAKFCCLSFTSQCMYHILILFYLLHIQLRVRESCNCENPKLTFVSDPLEWRSKNKMVITSSIIFGTSIISNMG